MIQYPECMKVVVRDVDHNVTETAATLACIGRKDRSTGDEFFSETDGFAY